MPKKRNAHKGKPIQFYLPAKQLAALDARVKDAGPPWTRASVVRELIALHLQQLALPGIK